MTLLDSERRAMADIAQAVAEEREQCCRDVCRVCREDGGPATRSDDSGRWHHRSGCLVCNASAILERAYQQAQRAQEVDG